MHAKNDGVTFTTEDRGTTLTTIDGRVGFDPASKSGSGYGMRERAGAVSANRVVDSASGPGMCIVVSLEHTL